MILSHALPVGLVTIFLALAYAVGMKLLRGLRLYENDLYPIGMERRGEHWVPARAEEERQWQEQHETLVREYWSWEKVCFALGLGLGVLAYGTLALALIHQLNPIGVMAGLALAALCAPGEIKRIYRWAQLPRDWRRRGESGKRGLRASLRTVFWILIAIPVAMSFLSALAPPHQSDALRYHLAVPAVYVQQGGWVFLPDNAFSNFPFAIEMLYALALVFGQDVACRLLHWAFFVLTLLTLYAFSKRLQSSSAGLMAAATLACTPFVPILSSWAFIEMGMTFYFLLTFQCLGLWLESLYRKGGKKGWLGAYQLELRPERLAVLGGVFCGLAMSVKYTALFLFVFGLGTIGLGLYRRTKLVNRLGSLDKSEREKAFLHSADARQGFISGSPPLLFFFPGRSRIGLRRVIRFFLFEFDLQESLLESVRGGLLRFSRRAEGSIGSQGAGMAIPGDRLDQPALAGYGGAFRRMADRSRFSGLYRAAPDLCEALAPDPLVLCRGCVVLLCGLGRDLSR